MTMARVLDVYEQHVKSLSAAERVQLITLIAQDLADRVALVDEQPLHNILELEGLGKEILEGVDAQEYVRQLRKEWDHRP